MFENTHQHRQVGFAFRALRLKSEKASKNGVETIANQARSHYGWCGVASHYLANNHYSVFFEVSTRVATLYKFTSKVVTRLITTSWYSSKTGGLRGI